VDWKAAFRRWAAGDGPRKARRRFLWAALVLSLVLLFLERGPSWFFDPRRGNPPDHVIVYTTAWCPVCERLRLCLKRHQVPFEERDVEASWRAGAEYTALDGDGVPLTLVGQQVAMGMRQEELEPALAAAGFHVQCWGDAALKDLTGSLRSRPKRR